VKKRIFMFPQELQN